MLAFRLFINLLVVASVQVAFSQSLFAQSAAERLQDDRVEEQLRNLERRQVLAANVGNYLLIKCLNDGVTTEIAAQGAIVDSDGRVVAVSFDSVDAAGKNCVIGITDEAREKLQSN